MIDDNLKVARDRVGLAPREPHPEDIKAVQSRLAEASVRAGATSTELLEVLAAVGIDQRVA